jgi:transcription antitermination factor NusG
MLDTGLLTRPLPRGWWAVYTKHQHEKVISEMLAAKGAEVFLPVYDLQRRRKQRTVTLTLPLFPGYLFVREQRDMRLAVVSTPGVHMIVTLGAELGVISDSEIQNLQIAISARRGIEPHPFCRLGERVRIVRGPLCGLEGILVRQKSGCRVVVSVPMLTQSASVEVHVSELVVVHGAVARGASTPYLAGSL